MSRPDGVTGCESDEIGQKMCLGDAEIGEQFARLTIKVVRHHLVRPRIFNCMGVFMWETISPFLSDVKCGEGN
jgi:hypothetical protein